MGADELWIAEKELGKGRVRKIPFESKGFRKSLKRFYLFLSENMPIILNKYPDIDIITVALRKENLSRNGMIDKKRLLYIANNFGRIGIDKIEIVPAKKSERFMGFSLNPLKIAKKFLKKYYKTVEEIENIYPRVLFAEEPLDITGEEPPK